MKITTRDVVFIAREAVVVVAMLLAIAAMAFCVVVLHDDSKATVPTQYVSHGP